MSTVLDHPTALAARAIGRSAREALRASDGRTVPIAGFSDAPYRLAGEEVVWIGTKARAMHPRMIVVDRLPPPGVAVTIRCGAVEPWQPPLLEVDRATYPSQVQTLVRHAVDALEPRGFGLRLAGRESPFPLALAARRLDQLVRARAANDAAAIESTAIALLGIGTGLTPSGDDFVGGMLFALRLIAPALHTAVTPAILAAAPQRTHVISAALLADTANGASYSSLHALAATLDLEAARALTTIGHSSGWDLLAGFALGATGVITVIRPQP